MLHSLSPLPPLHDRLAAGRPVLAQDQMQDLIHRIMAMTTAPAVEVRIIHTVRVATRLANGQVLTSDDGDTLTIVIRVGFNGATNQMDAGATTRLATNQLDLEVLRAIVVQCEAIDREHIRPENPYPIQPPVQDPYVPVQLWHDETIAAMRSGRATTLSHLLLPVRRAGLTAAGFVGLIARSEAYANREGIRAYCEETDSEVTVTARGPNGQSGWGGQAARDWTKMDLALVAAQAIEMAERSANPVAVEPGRRTAILSAAAVGQIMRTMAPQFVQGGDGGFEAGESARKIRWGGRYFDPRITMRSDPADPDGGYRPFFEYGGYGTPAMTWIERGILKNLANEPWIALARGKPYVDIPYSIRISGGPTPIEQMIAQCDEGIYVNRFSGVELVDRRTGMMTGTTRDGCFLIKHGKITTAVKNFRFLDSPFFFFNALEAIGPTQRVALGYVPNAEQFDWPLPPIIVPPMMVRDFNFSRTSDAI